MHSSQDFGVTTGHAGSNATLEGLEVCQNGWRLQHREQEAQDLQPSADVGEVGLVGLLLVKEKKRCKLRK